MSRIRVHDLSALANSGVRVRVSRLQASAGGASVNRIRVSRLKLDSVGGGVVASAGANQVAEPQTRVTLTSAGSSGAPATRVWSVQSVVVETTGVTYVQPAVLGPFDVDAAQDAIGDTCWIRTPAAFVNLLITMRLVVTGTGGSSVDTVQVKVQAQDRWYSTTANRLKPLSPRTAPAHPVGAVLI